MDSGNSSSMQSSSGGGGEEEYDSRADHSISAFFNHHNSATAAARNTTPSATLYHHHDNIGGTLPDPPPPPLPLHQPHLDPLVANYFTNLDTVWSSKTVRPGPHLAGPPVSQPPSEPVFFTNPTSLPHPRSNSSGSVLQNGGDNKNGDNNNNNNNNHNSMGRNPKKRSRASRRAPTTVLTTDTTNFRAMVQEFTGIPAPPFTGSSPFPRTGRFDLFGSSPNSSFPLKPFAQKLIPPSFLSSSLLSSSSSSSTTAINIASSSSPSSSGYYLPSAEHQNFLNMNTQSIADPFLNIHAPKDPLTDPSIFDAKSKPLFDQSQNIKVGNGLDELGHFGTNFGGLQSIVSSSSTSTLMHKNNYSDAQNVGADLLRSINGGFGASVLRAPSYRATAAAAASGSSTAPENNLAAARNEGMVESWICSSD